MDSDLHAAPPSRKKKGRPRKVQTSSQQSSFDRVMSSGTGSGSGDKAQAEKKLNLLHTVTLKCLSGVYPDPPPPPATFARSQ